MKLASIQCFIAEWHWVIIRLALEITVAYAIICLVTSFVGDIWSSYLQKVGLVAEIILQNNKNRV